MVWNKPLFTYHTNSRDSSPYDKCCPTGIELQANPKTENHARNDNPSLTTNHVSHREREKRAEENSSGENGYLLSKVKHSDGDGTRQGKMTNHKTFAVDWEEKELSAPIPAARFAWNVPNVTNQSSNSWFKIVRTNIHLWDTNGGGWRSEEEDEVWSCWSSFQLHITWLVYFKKLVISFNFPAHLRWLITTRKHNNDSMTITTIAMATMPPPQGKFLFFCFLSKLMFIYQ
jgi:hypothetical protein